jgi:hypothetical protein
MTGHRPSREPADDDPVGMTTEERTTWTYLAAVVLSTGAYVAVVLPRALAGPVSEVSWVVPLLWTLGASVAATVGGTVVALSVAAARNAARGMDPHADLGTDARDREIARFGSWRGAGVTGFAVPVVLVLAMLEVDHFWIGNAAFAAGVVGAVVETLSKIRAYRRGF